MKYRTDPYEPCPCGSGKKFKFCCMSRGSGKFPIGTVALYGPDDKITTKIVASVIPAEGVEPVMEHFSGMNVATDEKVAEKIKAFFVRHKVRNIIMSDGNMGCPHEEGDDFPHGGDCPFCPWWAGKQGSGSRG